MIGVPVLVGVAGGTLIASSLPTAATYARYALGDEAQALVQGRAQGPGVMQDARDQGGGMSGGAGPDHRDATLTQYEALLADALPAADRLVRVVQATVRAATPDAHWNVSVSEYPPEDLARVQTSPLLHGRLPSAAGEVAVDRDLARRLRLAVGDAFTTTLGKATTPTEVRVVGIVAGRNPHGSPGIVTTTGTVLPAVPDRPLDTDAVPGAGDGYVGLAGGSVARDLDALTTEWVVLGDAPVTWHDVRAVNAVGSHVVSRDVVEHPEQIPPADTFGESPVSTGTVALVAAVTVMALVEAVLLIGPAFAVGARRSERQLALLAASGAERRTLRHVVLTGGVVIGLLASVVAAAAGLAIAAGVRAWQLAHHLWGFPDLRVYWWLVVGAVALGTLVAAAAAWFPARRAARVDVTAALAGRRAEPRARRAVPIVGLAMFVAGAVAATFGAANSKTGVLVAGMLLLELGMVAASGGLVSLVARIAPFAGVAGRLALRDAARQRGRTAPAVAAVIAAIAGVSAGAVYTASQAAHDENAYVQAVADGRVVLETGLQEDPRAVARTDDGSALVARDLDVLRTALPVAAFAPARTIAAPPGADVDADGLEHPEWISAALAPGGACPVAEPERHPHAVAKDPRCWLGRGSMGEGFGRLVDDGTFVGATGVPGADRAAAALAAGTVVVGSPYQIWPDGTAHLEIPVSGQDDPRTVVVPAVAVEQPGEWTDQPVLPPAVAARLGVSTELRGGVVTTSRAVTWDEVGKAVEAVQAVDENAYLSLVDHDRSADTRLVLLVLVAAALVAGIGATAIALALSAAESRPDLATLGAVGASPSVRRRFAASQAGVVAVLGTTLGVVTGAALGHVVVVASRFSGGGFDQYWQPVVPWAPLAAIAVGVPALAMAGAAACTRSRLPMVRRVVG
ncbi:ABC transporter permease [Cellulomonas alba]|uniref:FtsX-like permease family protein n=1 Tax=Cellulomonas alba TaxID=3053467 RepID=A0ABT7SF92_9CELL|nr:FtsX-like permease family protein [Cellulomonas alba]MDM7854704.1 FtsX-like permease family protein [Cellulomonas alba]